MNYTHLELLPEHTLEECTQRLETARTDMLSYSKDFEHTRTETMQSIFAHSTTNYFESLKHVENFAAIQKLVKDYNQTFRLLQLKLDATQKQISQLIKGE